MQPHWFWRRLQHLSNHNAEQHVNVSRAAGGSTFRTASGCAKKRPSRQARESDDGTRFRTVSERPRAQQNALTHMDVGCGTHGGEGAQPHPYNNER